MMRRIVFTLMLGACGGHSTPATPKANSPIDCVALADHVLAITNPPAGAGRDSARADAIRTCPTVWHADHPSDTERQAVDCIMAAQTPTALAECENKNYGSGSGSGT